MKVEESLNVTFDESPHPSKTSPLVDDELVESQTTKNPQNSENDVEIEPLETDD